MGFAEVERGDVGGVVQEEDGGCVVGFLAAVEVFMVRGVGGAMGGEIGEKDAVGVDVEMYEQCFGYSEGGREGVVEDMGAVSGGEDVDFEGAGGGGVEDREEVRVGGGCGGGGRGEGCHDEGGGGGIESGCGGVKDCLAEWRIWRAFGFFLLSPWVFSHSGCLRFSS